MAAAEAEMDVPEYEVQRHASYWRNFVRFMVAAAVGTAALLIGMAIFLL